MIITKTPFKRRSKSDAATWGNKDLPATYS
jgi:hypothetical protein